MKLDDNGYLPESFINRLNGIFATRSAMYRNTLRYVKGENPAIVDKPVQAAPDNRVPVPYAQKIVRTLKGYMAKPGYITYNAEGDYQDILKSLFDRNDEELLTAELFEDALSGFGYEILHYNTDLELRQYRIAPDAGYPVYDDTLDRRMIAFVYRVDIEQADGSTLGSMTIYYKDRFVEYQESGSSWLQIAETAHPFGDVPAIEYKNNRDGSSVFTAVLPMIDEHDKIISSDYANELERFANAYLLMLKRISTTIGDDGLSEADKIKQLRIFDNLGADGEIKNAADSVAFLTKPSRGSDIAEAADRFNDLIYNMAMVIDTGDESFSAASGIALRYKLLPMEWLAADIEAYFSRGLQRRLQLIANALLRMQSIAPESVNIHFRRNIPTDVESLGIQAGALLGILSKRTILSTLFPADIVPNVDAEIEQQALESMEALPDDV